MTKPAGNPNCPPGLEYLTQLDQFLVHWQLELMESNTLCIKLEGGGGGSGQVRGGDGFQSGMQVMTKPVGNPNCPPGLEYLTQLDQLLVHQQLELMEGKMFCV